MDRNLVIETAYETIKDAIEWAISDDDNTFANYVDGIVGMTENLLEKLEKELSNEESYREPWEEDACKTKSKPIAEPIATV